MPLPPTPPTPLVLTILTPVTGRLQDEVQSDGKFDTRKLRGSSFRKPAKKASHHTRLAIGNALVAPWRYTKAKLYHPRHKSRTRFVRAL